MYSSVFIIDPNDVGSVEMLSLKEYEKLVMEDFAPGLTIEHREFQSRLQAEKYALLYDQLVKIRFTHILHFDDNPQEEVDAAETEKRLLREMKELAAGSV
jgi:hypothetical protein